MLTEHLLELLVSGTFVLLAIVLIARWARDRRPAAGWAALAFASLASILVTSLLQAFGIDTPDPVLRALVVAFVFFPYLLFRFSHSLEPTRPWVHGAAIAVTVVVALLASTLPTSTDGPDQETNLAFLTLFLLQWTALSLVCMARLWRAASGQPGVARKRLRFMAMATLGLNVAVLASVGGSGDDTSPVVSLLAILSAVCFYLGFVPPRFARVLWRAQERRRLDTAAADLMKADTSREIATILVPHVAAMTGANQVIMLDPKGAPLASAASESDGEMGEVITLPLSEAATLRIHNSSYTPYFAREEMEMLDGLAVLGGLALERVELQREERTNQAQLELALAQLKDAHHQLQKQVLERERAEAEAIDARAAAERANSAKTDFLSRMSHELRTPLSSILGFAQLLEPDKLDESQQECVRYIMKGGRHLLELINEVLDVARIEAGRIQLSLEPVEVEDVVEEALALVRPIAQDRGIAIEAPASDGGVNVVADRQRLKQVLMNLLSNAIKYNRDNGQIVVTVEREGENARIAVRDTGPGISRDRIDRLFVPFERLDADQTMVPGSGLGLALSQGLAEAMDGRIEVHSAVGDGSTFAIVLPLAQTQRNRVAPIEIPAPELATPELANGRSRVLYIEDNLANQKLVEKILQDFAGVELMTAMQGSAGLELARHHRPDVILLDLHLPDIGGYEILHRLRADPPTRAIPIVVLSADATPGQIVRLKDAGADEYVTKPIDVASFKSVISEMLGRKGRLAT